MKVIRKLMFAVMAAMVMFGTSCVKNEVPDEVKKLREEQLALAKAMTELKTQEAAKKGFEAEFEKFKAELKAIDVAKSKAELDVTIENAKKDAEAAKLEIERLKKQHELNLANLENQIKTAILNAATQKQAKLQNAFNNYQNKVSTYRNELNTLAAKNKDLVDAELSYKVQKATYDKKMAGIINDKEYKQLAVENQKAVVIKKEEALEAKKTELEELKAVNQSGDLEAALADLKEKMDNAEREHQNGLNEQEKAKGNVIIAQANYDKEEAIINEYEGYDKQIEDANKEKKEKEDLKKDKSANLKLFKEKYDSYVAEFNKEGGILAQFKDYKNQLEAEEVTRRKFEFELDEVLEKLGTTNGKYSDDLGYKIETGKSDTTHWAVQGAGDPSLRLLNPPDANHKYAYWIEIKTTATGPGVSKFLYDAVTKNPLFKELNDAYAAWKKQVEKIKKLKEDKEKLHNQYDFYVKETGYLINENDEVELIKSGWTEIDASESVFIAMRDNEDGIEDLTDEIEDLEKEITRLTNEQAAYKPMYDEAKSKIESLEKALNEANAAKWTIDKEVARLQGNYDGIKAAYSAVETDSNAIKGKIDTLEGEIKGAKDAVDEANKKLDTAIKDQLQPGIDEETEKQTLEGYNQNVVKAKKAVENQELVVAVAKEAMEEALTEIEAIKAA